MRRLLPIGLAILLLMNLSYGQFKKHEVTVPLSFDYYYSYDMVVDALKKLNRSYPGLTRVEVIGTSEEGRGIYAMTVNNPKSGKEKGKPGVYVDGNIHGNEIQAGEVCLYLLNYLLTKYGENAEVTRLVDKNVFYVVPSVNVDGRYHFMEDPHPSGNRGLRRPHDDDRDGLFDEDYPEDLDGDGEITMMRKRDPLGNLKTDPDDPRLMIPVKPGEKGEWIVLGAEGIDNDGDGSINEDSEGFVDGNRNWGFDWAPPYVQMGAGQYPFSGVGLKGISEWIRKRQNICVAWAFHNTGGMFLRGPSTKAQGEYPREDIAVYDYLGKQAERITPGYDYMVSWKDLYPTYGDFMEWMVMINGAYSFVGELFQVESETFKTRAEEKQIAARPGEQQASMGFLGGGPGEKERLLFNDHLVQGELYKKWNSYKHPTYGDIEIGGWVRLSSRISAPFMLKDLVHRNAMAVIFSAKQTPEISLDVFEVKRVGKGLYRIRTRLSNARAIPSMMAQSVKNKLYPQDMLTVSGSRVKVVAAGRLLDSYRNVVTYKEYRPEIQFLTVPAFGRVEHQFMISGRGEVAVNYSSRFGGKISKRIPLK